MKSNSQDFKSCNPDSEFFTQGFLSICLHRQVPWADTNLHAVSSRITDFLACPTSIDQSPSHAINLSVILTPVSAGSMQNDMLTSLTCSYLATLYSYSKVATMFVHFLYKDFYCSNMIFIIIIMCLLKSPMFNYLLPFPLIFDHLTSLVIFFISSQHK